MAEKCLRNMSCKCPLCAGEDLSMLLSITKNISSNIVYEDDDDDNTNATGTDGGGGVGRMTNSPPLPAAAARKPFGGGVVNSPPVPGAARAARSALPPRRAAVRNSPPSAPSARDVPMVDVSEDDTMMTDVPIEPMNRMNMDAHPPPLPPPAPVRHVPDESMEPEVNVEMTPATPLRDVRSFQKNNAMGPAPTAAAVAAPAMPVAAAAGASGGDNIPPIDVLLGQLADKNWKVRKEAFEHVKALCERPGIRSDEVTPILEAFPKMCEDANASAMEAGIQAVLAYTLRVEPFQKGIVGPVMKRVVDKGFASRPGIVKLCEELVIAFVEAGAAEDTVAALIEGTKNKKPKVPPACANSILECLKAFGPRVVPVQTVKASLSALCESTVNGVRPIALNILAEIHRWTGPALVQDIVSNLRQAQQTEYEALTKDVTPGQAQPTKLVRGARPQIASRSAPGRGAAASTSHAQPAAFDPREFAETVNLLDKLPKTEFRAKLAHPKWSEKVEGLKIVLDLIGPVPKLANGEYYELVNTLKLLSNDSNVNIVAKAIEVLGALSDGLRRNFTQYAKLMYPELMKKLSDKKSVVLNAVNNTLDLFLQHSMTIDMMMEEIRIGFDPSKNKAPQARVQTINFLNRCIEKKMVSVSDRAVVVDFGTLFSGALDDIDPTVRKAAVDAFIELAKATDQHPDFLRGLMDELAKKNPRSFKTIQKGLGGAADSAPSSRPSSAGSVGRPPSRGSASDAPDTDMSDVQNSAPTNSVMPARAGPTRPGRGPPSRLAPKNADGVPKPSSSQRKLPPAASTSSAQPSGSEFAPFSISVAPEEAEQIVVDLNLEMWGAITDGFASSKWMERKAAIEHLEDFAKSNPSMMSVRNIEALTMFLSKQVKDFRDSNINVLRSAFQAVGTFAEHASGKFPRGVVCLVVPTSVEKIGDRKACEMIRSMILQLCEATSPSYVLGCIVNHMPNVKTPLAHAEVLTVFSECVGDFGVSLCNPRLLVDYCKGSFGLESSNPKVRSGAITVLGVMYSQLGPALLPILNLETWKPALASTVEAEFKKVGFDPAKAAAAGKRQVKDDDDSGKKTDAGALFGRADISGQITKDLLADMKCEDDKAAWKKRLAAMENAQALCEAAACAIEFTKPVMELMKALKARLSDSNANLKVKAAQVIGVLATSIGIEVSKMSKLIGPSLLSGVADNKKNMQSASIDALHKWVRHNNQTSSQCVDSLLSSVSEALANPVGRAELLAWTAEHLNACDQRLDLSCLVVPTIQCLMDKSSEAREKAQLVLIEVIKCVGKDAVLATGCRDIKPAQMRTLRPLIDKAFECAGESELSSAPVAVATGSQVAAHVNDTVSAPPRVGRVGPNPLKPGNSGLPKPQLRASGSFRSASGDSHAMDTLHSSQEPSPTEGLLKMNSNKSSRLAKGQFNKWIFDSISQNEMAVRKSEIEADWRPFLSNDFHAKLFAPSLEKGMLAAMSDLMMCITSQPQEVLAALDLIFKWCTLRIVDNNVQALAKLLEVLVKLFEFLKSIGYHLDDVEAAILLPYLLQESGQSKPRFRVRFRDIMRLVADVYSTDNYTNFLVECFNTSKNMKSRCECIDLVEYIIKNNGINAVGKRCIKDIGKFVTAHEKELRESAINALMTVYVRTDGNLDKFFRFTGVTSQQGMDLVAAKIKYLRPETSVAPQPQTFGFGGSMTQQTSTARTPPRMTSVGNAGTPMSGLKQFNDMPVAASSLPRPQTENPLLQADGDIVMATPGKDEGNANLDPTALIHELLFQPIDGLLTPSREIVGELSPLFSDGVDALKGLYSIIFEPSDDSELHFLRFYVNEIALRLCDLIHSSLGLGDPKKPMSLVVLTLSLSTLHQLLQSNAIECIQRYAVERILLEASAKLLDPRFEELANVPSISPSELANLPIEKKRFVYIQKALNAVMVAATKRIKAGELYPSVINLLQRIVRNDVGDYNARDSYNHLLKKDSLDQLVGRLLLRISSVQAESLNPFEGIDIFGVLMQMHSFFSTLPQNDVFAVQIANDNMQKALNIIANSLMKARPTSFESSVNDLPLTSPVRELLANAGFISRSADSHYSLGSSRFSSFDMSASSSFAANGSTGFGFGDSASSERSTDSITRRLFDAGGPTTTTTTDSTKSGSSIASSRLSSFQVRNIGMDSSFRTTEVPRATEGATTVRTTISSLSDFARDQPQNVPSAPLSTSTTTRLLRERLEKVRKF